MTLISRVRKIAKIDYWLHHPYLSVSSHWTHLSRNLIVEE